MLLPKLDPIRDEEYRIWLRSQPCLFTGWTATEYDAVEAMHIGTLGRGIKSSDDECIPARHSIHARAHREGEVSVMRKHLPDTILRECVRAYARELYRQYLHDKETGNL